MATAPQVRAIYAMASNLGINNNSREDELHQLVFGITGKESIKELTESQARAVLYELINRMKGLKKASSNKKPIDVPPGKMTEDQQRKAWALIYRLQEVSPSSATASERMRGAVRKILGMEINTDNKAPFRMISVAEGRKLIDTLKKYIASAEKKAGVTDGH